MLRFKTQLQDKVFTFFFIVTYLASSVDVEAHHICKLSGAIAQKLYFLLCTVIPSTNNRMLIVTNSNDSFYWLLFRLNKLHRHNACGGFKMKLHSFCHCLG